MSTLRIARTSGPFAGLQLASIVFNLGNAITAIVYPWLVYDLTGSASWMGVIAFMTLTPAIVGSAFGGLVAERLGIRRTANLAACLGTAAAVMAALLYSLDTLTIGLLVALALCGAILDGPGGVAIESRVPEIARLARMPLLRANAIDDLVDSGAAIVGPAIAAVLVAVVDTQTLLWIIAAINAAAAVLVMLSLPQFRLRQASSTAKAEFTAALRIIFGSVRLRTALVLASLGTGTFVAIETVALPATLRAEGQPATALGIYLTAAAAGAIAVNLGLAAIGKSPSLRNVFVAAFIGLAAGVILLAIDRSIPMLIASGAVLGIAAGPLSPVFTTLLQTSAPKSLRAHVIGASISLILVAAPVTVLLVGTALDLFGAAPVLFACAGLLAACAAIAALALRRDEAADTTAL
ncbi:MFS transporter [Aminobacter aminovorans]|uniref:Multidrug efflux pump Tap n=1 Tax=Aminobacter aminovorans TaxID=83263 RepID=A0A380WHY4_AMIAI|nr:MFS transporter [Aminobacter aminovorans]TCS28749.1 MFS transporter [Aminobacter aminovorans]SUU88603.1 Probable multidrug-efflux transporter Rv1258c/MT1297 [Aminobacter aminovorans]